MVELGLGHRFPLCDGVCTDGFGVEGDVRRDAESCFGRAGVQNESVQFLVAVGGLDEELSLRLGNGSGFELAQAPRSCVGFDRQIAHEGEALPVESRSHLSEQDGRRSDKWNDLDSLSLCQCDDVGSGIGYGRTASFGDDTHVVSLQQRSEKSVKTLTIGMLIQRQEGAIVDGKVAMQFAEIATRGSDIFHDEMAKGANNVIYVRGDDFGRVAVAERVGYEIERAGHGNLWL